MVILLRSSGGSVATGIQRRHGLWLVMAELRRLVECGGRSDRVRLGGLAGERNRAFGGTLGRFDRLEVNQLELGREFREVVEGGGSEPVLEHHREALEGRHRFAR